MIFYAKMVVSLMQPGQFLWMLNCKKIEIRKGFLESHIKILEFKTSSKTSLRT